MHDLISILTIYYACNAAAAQSHLSLSEAVRCSLTYESIKLRFLTEAETDALIAAAGADRAMVLRNGYLRFKLWEKAHPDLVETLHASDTGD